MVGGPGVVHAMAGVLNSSGNCFPMLMLAGSGATYLVTRGTFQEMDAVSMLSPHVKTAIRWTNGRDALYPIKSAYRLCWYGRPGTGFVDLPADLLETRSKGIASQQHRRIRLPSPPAPSADAAKMYKVAQAILNAKAPLVLIGKGCAYARAEKVLRQLIGVTKLPFLSSPMGKGVLPDSHACNVSSARAKALRNADVVLVLGARLNWIFHFGAAPKYSLDARIIQVDIDPTVIGQNFGDPELGVVADVNIFAQQLLSELSGWQYPDDTAYWLQLRTEMKNNEAILFERGQLTVQPLKIEHAFFHMRTTLDKLSPLADGKVVLISEGARTMDTSRAWFFHEHPRLRLDAGSHGTMGVGMGYAIAAWEAYNGAYAEGVSGAPGRKKIVCIVGDSAFGFSGMEVETMARYGMDILIFVMNNSGVYHGHANSRKEHDDQQQATAEGRPETGFRSWSLGYETRYDWMADAVGGQGYFVRTSEELVKATEEGFKATVPVVINVSMESGKGTVAVSNDQQFSAPLEFYANTAAGIRL